ncbi:MAG: YHYH protein [Polaribacter sp.]|nr:YHYH protein [Polaribacter sp.]
MKHKFLTITALFSLLLASCSDPETPDQTIDETTSDVDISAVVSSVYNLNNGVTVSVGSDVIVVTGTGLPDHKTPYWDIENKVHEMYEPFPSFYITNDIYTSDDDMESTILEGLKSTDSNGNSIITYENNMNSEMTVVDYRMEIPTTPVEATNKEETDLGIIGLALNGVPIYNNYEGRSVLGIVAMATFDAAGAHPGPGSDYHYHAAAQLGFDSTNDGSLYPTINDSNLIGFLRDGFPVYGRQDADGSYPDLDENGGHTGVTADFSEGIYHYHCSNENYLDSGWYVIKSGAYHGTPGTASGS